MHLDKIALEKQTREIDKGIPSNKHQQRFTASDSSMICLGILIDISNPHTYFAINELLSYKLPVILQMFFLYYLKHSKQIYY